MAKAQVKHARVEGFDPVPHTADDTARVLADRAVRVAYDALEDEYAALRAVLSARRDAGLRRYAARSIPRRSPRCANMLLRAVRGW